MRILSDNINSNPSRIIFPVLDKLPSNPLLGEVVYFNVAPRQGLMIYTGTGWIELFATQNNIWETHIAEQEQTVFELNNSYNTDGTSIVMYKNGIRMPSYSVIEISPNHVGYREFDEEGEPVLLEGGEVFEFQIFNVRTTSPFDVKSFNRRVH